MNSMTSLLFKNGFVVTPQGRQKVDVLVRDGRVVEMGEGLEGDEVIDCEGKFLLPGAIDVHVHLRTPGETHKEDFESERGRPLLAE